MTRLRLIEEAVPKAMRLLDLTYPFRVRFVSFKHFDGRYVRFEDGLHVITLGFWLPVRRANWTLWHELVHARQCERYQCDSKAFHSAWMSERRKVITNRHWATRTYSMERYNSMPLEREANRRADRLHGITWPERPLIERR